MRIFILTLFSFLAVSPAFARLGETEAQCSSRYGQEVASTDAGKVRSVEFIKGDFIIVVTLSDGKSVCETYRKSNQGLNELEISEILSKNGGGEWKRGAAPDENLWTPRDGVGDEGASYAGGTLVVWASGGREALATLKNAEDQSDQASSQKKAQQTTSGL